MRRPHPAPSAALVFLLALAGCGGGGGSSTPSGTNAPPAGAPEAAVVAYDYDGDQDADVLTLDPATSPMKILSALEGNASGDLVPAPGAVGSRIDAKISDAIAAYLGSSFEIGEQTEIETEDSSGNAVTVTIYE